MTTNTSEQLVADYLARLEQAARRLEPGRRAELLTEIRAHIDAARAAGAAADEAAVRTMLDRLGEPEEIVAAANDESPTHPDVVPVQPGTGLELAAALLLTVGSLIPLAGWAVGAVLLWASRRWTTREKLLGTLVVPGGPAIVLWVGAFASQSCVTVTDSSGAIVEESCTGFALPAWLGITLFVTVLVAPFIVAGVLVSRARARAAEEPPVMRPARPATGPSRWGGNEIAATLVLALGGVAAILFSFSIAIGAAAAVVGLVFVWASRRWTRREQKTATAIVGIMAALTAIAASIVALLLVRAGEDGSGLGALFMMPVGISMIAAAVYLAVALNRRQA